VQLAIAFPEKKTRGGRRKGAGRKRSSDRVSHATRVHKKGHPVHVTLKAVGGVASLRGYRVGQRVCRYFRTVLGRWKDFRVVAFSVQSNHVHLIVEADNARALSRGMQGLASGLARLVNACVGRGGKLWRDRYHARELTNPTMTRHAMRYVLQNNAHHGGQPGIDPLSSATWCAHWIEVAPATTGSPVAPPQTWLLRYGWHELGGGPLSVHEGPAEH
jgi:putative transposase